jgi:hypothetical protein
MTIDRLKEALDCLNRERLGLLNRLANIAPDELYRKPDPQRWSLVQVLQHLVLAEREVLQHLPDLADLVHRKQYPYHFISYAMVLLVLKWGIPVPVPSSAMVSDGNTTLTRIRAQWDRNFEWLTAYVNGLSIETARQAVFIHPVCGPLTISQALYMDRLHLSVHTRQINRMLQQHEMQKA